MHFQSPVVTSVGWTESFDLALASAAVLGVLGEAASSTVKFLPALCRGRHLSIRVFFYKVYSKHLGLS